jgi:hypothetical protein
MFDLEELPESKNNFWEVKRYSYFYNFPKNTHSQKLMTYDLKTYDFTILCRHQLFTIRFRQAQKCLSISDIRFCECL